MSLENLLRANGVDIDMMTKKAERTEAVNRLTVSLNGLTWDADEVSQSRMARSIVAMSEEEQIPWVMADNTAHMVTKAMLREALHAAGEAQTALWLKPYE